MHVRKALYQLSSILASRVGLFFAFAVFTFIYLFICVHVSIGTS